MPFDRGLDQGGLVHILDVVRADALEDVAEQVELLVNRGVRAVFSCAISGPATCVLSRTPPAIPPMAAMISLFMASYPSSQSRAVCVNHPSGSTGAPVSRNSI